MYAPQIAKLATGLVLADALYIVWLSSVGVLPINFFGIVFVHSMVVPSVIFDSVFALLLVHYGWDIQLPVRSIRERTMLYIIGTLFAAVALIHWSRITLGLNLTLGSWLVPVWLSWIAIIATTYLSYLSFHFALLRRK